MGGGGGRDLLDPKSGHSEPHPLNLLQKPHFWPWKVDLKLADLGVHRTPAPPWLRAWLYYALTFFKKKKKNNSHKDKAHLSATLFNRFLRKEELALYRYKFQNLKGKIQILTA